MTGIRFTFDCGCFASYWADNCDIKGGLSCCATHELSSQSINNILLQCPMLLVRIANLPPKPGVCGYCGADRSGPSAEAHDQNCPNDVAKIRRQNQGVPRKDSHFRLAAAQYSWLVELAAKYKTSKAKVLDAILRDKPEPNEFYLR